MLGFVQTWFAPSANPIGIDLGTDYLRMAQVEPAGGESASASDFRLIAAASVEIPESARIDPAARINFFAHSVRDLLALGNFRGRRAVLALPASLMHVAQILLPLGSEDAPIAARLPGALAGLLPVDSANSVLRHLEVGPVRRGGKVHDDVIAFAADRSLIEQYVSAAAGARLDVVGMNLEPKAIVDCFSHVYRRKSDHDVTSCYIDIGGAGTRVVMARGERILFARMLDIGGDRFSQAVADAMKISLAEARLLRIKHCPGRGEQTKPQAALHDISHDRGEATNPRERQAIEKACQAPLRQLIADLRACRADHEAKVRWPVNRLIFVGGEARQRGMCAQMARELDLPAQLGDPLVRMGRISEVGVESGIDRRQPQPAWVVALGLSMGPARFESPAAAAAGAEAARGSAR